MSEDTKLIRDFEVSTSIIGNQFIGLEVNNNKEIDICMGLTLDEAISIRDMLTKSIDIIAGHDLNTSSNS